jgi:hypothetical protein
MKLEFPEPENKLLNEFDKYYSYDLKSTPILYEGYRDFYEKCLNDVACQLLQIIKKPNALIEIKRLIEPWEKK